MRHYDQFEWKLYKKDLLDDSIRKEMENHLLDCDECMDIFISLIDDEEVDQAGYKVSENFTTNVMKGIDSLENQKLEIKENKLIEFKEKEKRKKKKMFVQYVAVASITIIMTATGLFDRVIASSMPMDIPMKQEESMPEKIYNLSENILNDFSKTLDNFNRNNFFNK